MKIKQDFVTNSSSCSYLVYIPDNFDIKKAIKENQDMIDKQLSKEWIAEEFTKEEFEREMLQNHLALLKHGEINAYPFEPYEVLSDIYNKNDFMLHFIEQGGENEDSFMINMNCQSYKNKIKKLDGDKNETEIRFHNK